MNLSIGHGCHQFHRFVLLSLILLFAKAKDLTNKQSLISAHILGKVRFFLGGMAGASEGRVISESEHQKGRAISHVSYSREGHTSFPEFFNENFCDVAFHFSYRLSFSFHLL